MKKIVKFGGSSLANAEQFQKVGEIIRSDESRRYVVPSAPGKRFDGDTKITDLLYKCYNTAVEGEDFIPILQEIKGRYYEIIRGLNLDLSLEDEFAQIEADFKAFRKTVPDHSDKQDGDHLQALRSEPLCFPRVFFPEAPGEILPSDDDLWNIR